MRIDNKMEELFREFGSSMSVNVMVHGPGDVSDLRNELLRGCVQCGERIGEFMLSQDIACALTAGEYELKSEASKLLKGLWNNAIPLSKASTQIDGLVRAAGAAAKVLKTLKENDPTKFLEVLSLLWRYEQETKTWKK
jgi:hypothetical protein